MCRVVWPCSNGMKSKVKNVNSHCWLLKFCSLNKKFSVVCRQCSVVEHRNICHSDLVFFLQTYGRYRRLPAAADGQLLSRLWTAPPPPVTECHDDSCSTWPRWLSRSSTCTARPPEKTTSRKRRGNWTRSWSGVAVWTQKFLINYYESSNLFTAASGQLSQHERKEIWHFMKSNVFTVFVGKFV